METRKIVQYEEISAHFKQRLVLKYSADKTLIDVETNKGKFKAIEIWYWCVQYAVLVDDRILGMIEWDSCQYDECEEEWNTDFNLMNLDGFPKDMDDLFYS